MTERFDQDETLSQWYRSLAHPQPSEALDDSILALAREQANETRQYPAQELSLREQIVLWFGRHMGISNWRKWQWPVGLVVSAGGLFLVFWGHLNNFDPGIIGPQAETQPKIVKTEADTPQASVQKIETVPLELADPLADENEPVLAFKPAMTDYEALAEQEARQFSEQLQRSVELTLEQEIEQQTSQDLGESRELNETDSLLALAGEAAQDDVEAIVVTGSRIAERSSERAAAKSLVNEAERIAAQSLMSEAERVQAPQAFLQQMLERHQALLAQQSTTEDQVQWQQRVTESQNDIYQYLRQMKLLNPSATIDSSYLNVLTEQQKQQLNSTSPQGKQP